MTKEDLMPPKPQFSPTISFGQMVQICVLLVGIVAGYVTLQNQADSNAKALSEASQARSAMETRLRALETQQARADERFSSILGYLTRIDTRLERIEGSSKFEDGR